MELWLCGRMADEGSPNHLWHIQGIFQNRHDAVQCCRDQTYFIIPLKLDEALPHESTALPSGFCYPMADGVSV